MACNYSLFLDPSSCLAHHAPNNGVRLLENQGCIGCPVCVCAYFSVLSAFFCLSAMLISPEGGGKGKRNSIKRFGVFVFLVLFLHCLPCP